MAAASGVRLVRWDDMPREDLANSIGRRFITGEKVMVAQIHLPKGALVPKHRHDNEQISNVLSGRLEFRLGETLEETRIVGAGEVLVIPSGVPHEVIGVEDSLALDTFAPPRQDWIDGTDAYLRNRRPEASD